ncbi:LysR family transcriptional regulator [Leptothermofonsia sichuanensis E412]|uniref:LysR family transcriptional regulator n=1 Tax=Leptothermofonsia sichuanensis TaxID=2917832 RepID=UPI001CA6FC50|nr:LysR substrate-binding domain-containing protein [Leptothermofonsia sichuanensis]QZZ21754.1 LysR family transcriptional regulator [Leptothermofonsia sichuanensis E412]
MEVYQVRVFLEVARHLSFTEAADALNLTQPAVSAKIKSLESELGVPLFYRLGRKIQLTEVGQFLLEEGIKLIEVENQLLQKVEEIKQGKFGHLRLGTTGAIAHGWLPDILFTYCKTYPRIQANCQVFDTSEALYRALVNQQIDLGISDVDYAEFSEIGISAIDTIHYNLIVSASHALANQPWVSLRDLIQQPWVLQPAGQPSRMFFEARLQELGLSLASFPQVETIDTLSLMRTYIERGNYIGFASEFEFRSECELGTLVAIPVQEFCLPGNIFLLSLKRVSDSQETIASIHKRRSPDPTPAQKFVNLLQQAKEQSPAREVDKPMPQPAATWMRLRSPSFTLRPTCYQRPEVLSLNIGIQNGTIPTVTAGLIIQRLGLMEHFLPRNGSYSGLQYQIQWRDFSSGAPIVNALADGQLNIGILGDYPLLLSALQSQDPTKHSTRLVSFVAINPDGSCNAVIVPNKSRLQEMQDLRGRIIAVPLSSSAHGMLLRSLNAANLLDDVKIAALSQARVSPFLNFEQPADGYAHFAPFHDIACHRGKFRYLADSCMSQLPAFYGVVVSSEMADHYPEVVVAYLRALAVAQHWYNTTPSAPTLVSQWTQLETAIVHRILNHSTQDAGSCRFLAETQIRSDWLTIHLAEMSGIPGNEEFSTIHLERWIQPEFLQKLSA